MDYRNVNVDRVGWVNGKAFYGGAGKVMVQTPTASCRIAPLASFGPHAHNISLKCTGSRTAGFREFIAALERSAETKDHGVIRGLRLTACVGWDDTMKCSSFGDTLWFDTDGAVVSGPTPDWRACACLLQLTGLWISSRGGSWGLKWRVLECKKMEDVPTDEAEWAFREADEPLLFRD